ncbi:hypothetical protein [Streptomyces sp. NPDC057702]|uniref:hypothetical protein n=1 Tax=unclassified Streptomyces TaxID=2593676 RepID=UPI0036AE0C4A
MLIRLPAGVLLFLTPVLLMLSPLLGLYALARLGRLAAWHVFVRGSGPVPVHDPDVARLKALRMWAAVGFTLVVLAAFGSADDIDEQVSDRWVTLLAAPWLLIASGPVVLGVLIWCAPPARRPAMRAALRGPLRQLLCFFGTLALVPALFAGLVWLTPDEVRGLPPFALLMAGLGVCVWSVFLFLFASLTVTRTGFGAADVHPAAPALLTIVLVWVCAVVTGRPTGPPVLAYTLLVGGPATVTALACWEISRLRTRYGVRLRG